MKPSFKKHSLAIHLVVLCLFLNTHVTGKDCVSDSAGCTCTFNDGSGIVDLTSLGNTDGTPRFKDVPKDGDQSAKYSYNPCGPFNEMECSVAAACLTMIGGSQNIGDADSAVLKYDEDSDQVYAGYTSQSGAVTKSTQVKLICDKSATEATFTPTDGGSSDVIVQYFAELRTVCACPGGCSSSGPIATSGSGSLSVGSIILIAIFALLILYLAVGTVYMKAVKKATGTDVIPNKNMWVGGFTMIGSGFKFLLGKCFPGKFSEYKSAT